MDEGDLRMETSSDPDAMHGILTLAYAQTVKLKVKYKCPPPSSVFLIQNNSQLRFTERHAFLIMQ